MITNQITMATVLQPIANELNTGARRSIQGPAAKAVSSVGTEVSSLGQGQSHGQHNS